MNKKSRKGHGSTRDNAMQTIDVRNLLAFNHRMSMFIWSPDQWTIIAFIHGYEYGRSRECRFTELLSDLIAKKYRVKINNMGWPGQILRFAESHSISWSDAYLLLSSELLNSQLISIGSEGAATPAGRPYRNTPIAPDDQ